MQYHIKEWANMSASLVAEDGHILNTFESAEDAIDACINQCLVTPAYIERHFCYLDASPVDFESSFL